MEVSTEYRETEIGAIPVEWSVEAIDNIATVIRGASPRPKGDPRYYGGSVPRLMVEDVTRDGKYVTPRVDSLTEAGARRSRPCEKGTLTIVCSGDVGITSFLAVDACIHDGFLALINLRDRVFDDYLYHFLDSQRLRFDTSATHGGVFTNLTTNILRQFKIPLPPRPEQRAIAEVLSDVDALIEQLDALIAKKRAVKTATMQRLLTGEQRLPGFSEPWETKSIKALEADGKIRLGRGNVISQKDIERLPGPYPIYSSSVKKRGLFGTCGDYMFDQEMITWSIDGGGNFFHRPKHRFSVTNVCGFMQVRSEYLNCKFLASQLQLLHARRVFDYQTKAHPSVIRDEYEVTVPPINEQQAIAQILSDMDAEIEALEARREKTQRLKQGMMQELLTGRTRLV